MSDFVEFLDYFQPELVNVDSFRRAIIGVRITIYNANELTEGVVLISSDGPGVSGILCK